jgi:hypothetical protein
MQFEMQRQLQKFENCESSYFVSSDLWVTYMQVNAV